MTNLPTNPTKTEIMERYWFEFLQYLQAETVDKQLPHNLNGTFGLGTSTSSLRLLMPVKLPDDNSLPHRPLIDANKVAQVVVSVVGLAVVGLVLAYR